MYVVFFLNQYSDRRGRNLKLNHHSDVYENQLSGELPASWSALPNIVNLYVLENPIFFLPTYVTSQPDFCGAMNLLENFLHPGLP